MPKKYCRWQSADWYYTLSIVIRTIYSHSYIKNFIVSQSGADTNYDINAKSLCFYTSQETNFQLVFLPIKCHIPLFPKSIWFVPSIHLIDVHFIIGFGGFLLWIPQHFRHHRPVGTEADPKLVLVWRATLLEKSFCIIYPNDRLFTGQQKCQRRWASDRRDKIFLLSFERPVFVPGSWCWFQNNRDDHFWPNYRLRRVIVPCWI